MKHSFLIAILAVSAIAHADDSCTAVLQKVVGHYSHCVDLTDGTKFSMDVTTQSPDPEWKGEIVLERYNPGDTSPSTTVGNLLRILGKSGTITDPSTGASAVYESHCSDSAFNIRVEVSGGGQSLEIREYLRAYPNGDLEGKGWIFFDQSKGQFSCQR